MESYFTRFRNGIIGLNQTFNTPFGEKKIVYTDWTATGRIYKPIEDILMDRFYRYVGNTHTEMTITGKSMTLAYHEAHNIIKQHVNAGENDVIITCGSGMTEGVSKIQRILGLKVPEQILPFINYKDGEKPLVFVTHMEHHSNQTAWVVSLADVIALSPDKNGQVDLNELEENLILHRHRRVKIGAFTACSNVTGIQTDYYEMARLMHKYDGYCFVDFAASAPYVKIDMHPGDEMKKLDAIFFSPHKFLGGPGSSGVLIFDKSLYHNKIPDRPGGGTVVWSNPWGQYVFLNDIEVREDGGTPPFIQTIKAALTIKLKEEMGMENMLKREKEILEVAFDEMSKIEGLHILAGHVKDRLAIISFYADWIHFNLLVKVLNDLFGIQSRGGCSCAGTYMHHLLNVDYSRSNQIIRRIEEGYLNDKPGWVRTSFHPTTTDEEARFVCNALRYIKENAKELESYYDYSVHTNEYVYKRSLKNEIDEIRKWFVLG